MPAIAAHGRPPLARVLIPIPGTDFDPTEVAVPACTLMVQGHDLCLATPDGRPGTPDLRMLDGTGLGPLAPLLRADAQGRAAWAALAASPAWARPLARADLPGQAFDAWLLPGGHAPGMKTYLESALLQGLVASAFEQARPVGAICHGVVLAARARRADGRSVLHGRRTTALLRTQELAAWAFTAAWLGRYYRTYPVPVQDEVTAALARPQDFVAGPLPLQRDAPGRLSAGFALRDGPYLSARWPGDAHRFAHDFVAMLAAVR